MAAKAEIQTPDLSNMSLCPLAVALLVALLGSAPLK
jgi:hypothetical protein